MLELKNLGSAVLFIFTVGTGFWLGSSGKPYNSVMFTAHKLIALAAVVLTGVLLANLTKSIRIDVVIIILIIAAAISVLALFVSGALLSTGSVSYSLLKAIHRIAPVLAVIATGLAIFTISRR